MARLCVRIAPNGNARQPAKDVLRTREGDVVDIQEDGHVWSQVELHCGQYRFLDAPGVPATRLAHLMAAVYDRHHQMLQRRKVMLALPSMARATGPTRTGLTLARIKAMTVPRT